VLADEPVIEVRMISPDAPVLNDGWETVFYAIPCILLGMAAIFRLDGIFGGPGRRSGKSKAVPGCDDGQPIMRDPDGRRF